MTQTSYFATGKRKSAVARVYMREGKDEFIVNSLTLDKYFGRETDKMVACQPLELTQLMGKFSIKVNVRGGGSSGQAGAIKHGISRTLLKINPELRGKLKEAGFLTRDARIKERKKYGLAGARRGYQFSKR